MIALPLSKTGNPRWTTQHSSKNTWDIDPMVIPRCARCFGVFIFWESVIENTVIYSVTAMHLPPGTKNYVKTVSKELLKRIPKDVPNGKPYCIILGGGKIDTPQNKFFYRNSIRGYILPLQRKYPSVEILFLTTQKNTLFTTMYLKKNGEVEAKNYFQKLN